MAKKKASAKKSKSGSAQLSAVTSNGFGDSFSNQIDLIDKSTSQDVTGCLRIIGQTLLRIESELVKLNQAASNGENHLGQCSLRISNLSDTLSEIKASLQND